MNNEINEKILKKKHNLLFTIFACIMTGIIVFLATNLGNKAAKVVNPDTKVNNQNTETSNVDSNSNNNSNVTSNQTMTSVGISMKDLNRVYSILNFEHGTTDYIFMESTLGNINGKIADIPKDSKTFLIYLKALDLNLVTTIDGKDYELCNAGSGECSAIEVNDFKEISKLYGITDDYNALFIKDLIYKDKNNKEYVLYTFGGFGYEETITHKFTTQVSGKDIIIIDNATLTNEETKRERLLNKEYTFKLNNEGEYYLYSSITK